MNNGYIKLYRKIKDHWIYQNSQYLSAWLDILLNVNWSDQRVLIGGQILECKRGQSLMSLESWAETFGANKRRGSWTVRKVRVFFDLLQQDEMIVRENVIKTSRLTVCNFDTYQNSRHDDGRQTAGRRQADDNQTATNNKDKKGIREEDSKASCDADYLISLKNNQTYKHINIDLEFGKMQAWIGLRPGRKITRRFIINWLNKIEVPFNGGSVAVATKKPDLDCQICGGKGNLHSQGTGKVNLCSCVL